jgi:hypothetical protein
MSPIAIPLAMSVVMLWLIWSDSVRRRPTSRIFYLLRCILFLGAVSLLVYNLVTYPGMYRGSDRSIVFFAITIGVIGAIYFVRRAMMSPLLRGEKR